jgi:hypothetical protein
MKADPWAKYCIQWWLVVAHPTLVEGLSVPEAWGIMSPPSGRRRRSMTIVRPAPILKPGDTGPAWRRVAAWYEHRTTQRLSEAEYALERAKSDAEMLRRDLAQRDAAGIGRTDRRAATIGQIVHELDRQRTGWDDPDVDQIVATILDVAKSQRLARRARDEIGWLIDEARRRSAPLDLVARDLADLLKAQAPEEAA